MAGYRILVWSVVLVVSLSSVALLSPTGPEGQCVCSGQTKCKCCRIISFNYKLREIQINDTVCVKIRNLKTKTGFRFAVFWNKRSLISHRLTTANVPPFCFATPYIHYVDVCLKFKDLRITGTQISGCLGFEIESGSSSEVFPSGCFLIKRKALAANETEGNPFRLLSSSETKRITLKDATPLKNYMRKNGINGTSLAIWMKLAKVNTTRNVLGDRFLSKVQDRTSLSRSDCWCDDSLVVVCECCVPIIAQNAQHRGCVKLTHVPYSKDLNISFILDGKLKINENIPSTITKRLCTHHRVNKDLKVGACVKPLRHQRRQNRNGLCIDIDARKPHFRFKHRVGCVRLVVAWER